MHTRHGFTKTDGADQHHIYSHHDSRTSLSDVFQGRDCKAQSAANTRGISSICNAVKRVLETRQKGVFLSRDGYTSRVALFASIGIGVWTLYPSKTQSH
jgi:hypothetical protein